MSMLPNQHNMQAIGPAYLDSSLIAQKAKQVTPLVDSKQGRAKKSKYKGNKYNKGNNNLPDKYISHNHLIDPPVYNDHGQLIPPKNQAKNLDILV